MFKLFLEKCFVFTKLKIFKNSVSCFGDSVVGYPSRKSQPQAHVLILATCSRVKGLVAWVTQCKVEFIQPSNWLYSVPNLLVFQHLVTLYLGGLVVSSESDRVKFAQECARK